MMLVKIIVFCVLRRAFVLIIILLVLLFSKSVQVPAFVKHLLTDILIRITQSGLKIPSFFSIFHFFDSNFK